MMAFSETTFILHMALKAHGDKNLHEKIQSSGDTAERSPPPALNLYRSQFLFLFLKATEAATPRNKQQLVSPTATHKL